MVLTVRRHGFQLSTVSGGALIVMVSFAMIVMK
jgi:hypothetical protein